MSENNGDIKNAAGDAHSAAIDDNCSTTVSRRAPLLTAADALECAQAVLARREGGPHASGQPIVADKPTRDEIELGVDVVFEVLGSEGSEARARANSLSKRGLIDLEEGLGHWLADRFAGELPATEDLARRLSKRASGRLAGKKEKAKWKEMAKAARRKAEKGGADAEAVAAAGVAARAAAEAAFGATVVDPDFKAAGLTLTPAAPAEPPAEPPAELPARVTGEGVASSAFVEELKASVAAGKAIAAAAYLEH